MAVIGKEGVRVWFKVRCKLWPEGHDAGERGEGEGWGRGGATRVRARVTIRGSRSEGMAASFVGGRVRVRVWQRVEAGVRDVSLTDAKGYAMRQES